MNYKFVERTKGKKFADVVAGEVFYDSNDSGECFMRLKETCYSSGEADNFNVVNIDTGVLSYFFDSERVIELKASCTVEIVN
jgi:hypothetical protein